MSADYYWIRLNNDIIDLISAGGLAAPFLTLERGPPALLAECTATTAPAPCPTANVLTNVNGVPVGYPAFEIVPYANIGTTTTAGFDIDLRSHVDIGALGRLTVDVNFTRMLQYEYAYLGTNFDLVGTHGPSGVSGDTGNPSDRAVGTLTWDRGPVTASLTVNYISSFKITDPSAGYHTCAQALASGAPSAYGPAFVGTVVAGTPWVPYCSVAHFTSANLYARYAVTDHFDVHGAITNVFNSDAPVELQTYGGGAELHYDAALHQDGAVGRFFMLGVTFKY